MLNIKSFFSLEGCPVPAVFQGITYPWEALAKIGELITEMMQAMGDEYRQIAPQVWVGEGTKVADTARFQGPAIFGKDCEIRPNAYIRGNVIAGDGVVVGNASEVKQAILFSHVQLPHYNYVGDSIIGFGAHLGAGAITSNFKTTKEPVRVRLGEQVIETGLRKFGAILGDEVEVGCNSVLNPGTLVGAKSIIYPLCSVRGCIPSQVIYKSKDEIVPYR